MWDEEINKKIKDAADQYHPAYDDAAWGKMEQMLDEHLPQKKDRRRIIYFIPLAILVAGLALFMIFHKDAGSGSKISGNIASKNNSENTKVGRSAPAKVVIDPKVAAQPKNLATIETGDKTTISKDAPVNALNAGTKNTTGFAPHNNNINLGKRRSHLTAGSTTPGSVEAANDAPVAVNEQKDPAKESVSEAKTEPGKTQPDDKRSTSGNPETSDVANSKNPVSNGTEVIKATKEPEKLKDVARVEDSKATKTS